MSYILGVIIGIASLIGAVVFLNQPAEQFFDEVAFAVVIGGTFAIAVITMPWEYARDIFGALKSVMTPRADTTRELLADCMSYIQSCNSGTSPDIKSKGLPKDIMSEGHELLVLNFPPEDIETILQERVDEAGERSRIVADSFRALAKYPPAFGLTGTVLGLVSLMRAITEGLETRQTGMRMAIALIATLYGLMLSNLVIAPLGESILKRAVQEKRRAQIALQAVLLAADHVSLLKAQEMLNSLVPTRKRIDFIGGSASGGGERKAA